MSGINVCVRHMHSHQSRVINLGRYELKFWYMKRHCLDVGGKRDEAMKSEYDRRSSGLESGPSDMFWLEDRSFVSTMKTPTIIEEED